MRGEECVSDATTWDQERKHDVFSSEDIFATLPVLTYTNSNAYLSNREYDVMQARSLWLHRIQNRIDGEDEDDAALKVINGVSVVMWIHRVDSAAVKYISQFLVYAYSGIRKLTVPAV